ncbi:hypothetical protein A1O1_00691 [Capronia coronata CBS 617.96]|uniref:Mediator of RNA polymerase II transcription subunit 14 n=1 Tax=Capronia coronata CBS 617.96 TaxID=1182541 RepID=W9ZM49_9EURO|nr:uncharacterized protein A1O1_00691 [Capronia coronata CBS 617.96]EXJ95569.1 hypothetical protein A1O1_00691 [Capronia coronata CBS 617.96]
MNGDRPTANGERIPNGVDQDAAQASPNAGHIKQERDALNLSVPGGEGSSHANGDSHASQASKRDMESSVANDVERAPSDILHLIPKDNYLPIAALISRASQACWNGLTDLVEELASIQVPEQPTEQTKPLPNNLPNNQTTANLDKKERLLQFANDQKADFVKLLVLLQWSKNVDDVSKTISINFWLMKRRQAYWDAIASLAALKQESAGFQLPNPDLKGAAEVLSTGRVRTFSTLGYIPQEDLSDKQILRLLRTLNRSLSVKLTLLDNLPSQLRRYRVHDGRITFTIPNEFEVDLSILDDSPDAQFRMVDFRFCFSPAPHVPESLRSEIELYANTNIDRDGLQGCYLFLHELALSYKLAEFHKQAVELARTQWAGNLRVEMIRRNLVIQYWPERQIGKSWIEIGIASGKAKKDARSQELVPFLEIKAMRQGKKVESLQVHLQESVLSLDEVLHQVIAQHSTDILDSIYDKLVLTTLFAKAELVLDQDISYDDPEECSLTMQVSRSSRIQIKIEPVTGLLLISPVSERSERLQYEINRIHGVADEIVSKLLNFRCSVREASVFSGITGTSWEALRAFKLNQAEIKTLFGTPVVRINMFRQPQWGLGYSLAITHGQHGDHWYLLQQLPSPGPNLQPRFHVIRSQGIAINEELSGGYFERLADYATGLICLQRNADYLKERKEEVNLPPFPAFGRKYELPELTFDLDLSRPALGLLSSSPPQPSLTDGAKTSSTAPDVIKSMKLCFGGLDRATNKVTTIGQFQNRASSAALKHIDASILGPHVTLNSEDRSVTIRVQTSITEAAIPDIIANAMDLEKIVSTVEQLHRLPGLQLKNLSNSAITIAYQMEESKECGLTMAFTRGSEVPQLEFLPANGNPHALLATHYAKLFAAGRVPFASQVRDLWTSLIVTLPLLTFLRNLQDKHGLNLKESPGSSSDSQKGVMRVHLLTRTTTAFGVQYFTSAAEVPRDVGPGSHPHLLARLEILPHLNASRKPMWLVRAALEDFQSYSRPSYCSQVLRDKLRQDIFARADNGGKWLALDSAAICKADQPQALLQAIHDLLCDFVKEGKASAAVSEGGNKQTKGTNVGKQIGRQDGNTGNTGNKTVNHQNLPNGNGGGNSNSKPSKIPVSSKMPPHGDNAPPNGGIKPQWPPANANMNTGRPGVNAKGSSNAGRNKEVITLD